jgi:chaperonin GroES
MKTTITPLGENVLIKPVEATTQTESGIYIPDTASSEKPQQGEVIAIGDSEKIKVEKGQVVMYKKYGGEEIKVENEDFIIVKAEEIIAVIK